MSDAWPVALWRRPVKRGPSTPLVVLLHGRGADETDLISLADELPPAFAYVSPRGLVALDDGGYSWFESRAPGRPVAASLRASVTALRTWLDDPARTHPRAPVFVLGFSAGMMMAAALALDDPGRFAGAILLSGVVALDGGIPANTGRLKGLPVFYGRGTLDTVLPAMLVTASEAFLRERSGADLTLREYRHGHAISPREIADICGWLGKRG